MKKIILSFSVTVALLITSFYSLVGCSCTLQEANAVTYVNLSLNPNVELVLDTANRVVSVNAMNDDGELLLSEETYIGERVQTVLTKLIELASKSGLFDVNQTEGVFYISVVNEDAEYANNLFELLKQTCNNYAKTNGIYALGVNGQVSDEMILLANEYNLSVGHLRLCLKLQELNPDLTWEEILAMPISEVVQGIHNQFLNIGAIYLKQQKEAFKQERLTLRQNYEQSLRTLFGLEYAGLLDELALLESQIESVEGEALENLKTAIQNKQAQIESLRNTLEVTYQAEYQTLRETYLNDLQALITSYKESSAAQREALKNSLQNKIAENENKLQTRINYAKNRNNNFARAYDLFLALKESDLFNFFKSKLEELNGNNEEINADLAYALTLAEKYSKIYEKKEEIS